MRNRAPDASDALPRRRIVLLPGMDGTGELFAGFLHAIRADFDATVVSYPTAGTESYRELEEIAKSYLPANRPYFLLAESFSGPIGISIAASTPPNLIGLILCCSFLKWPRRIPRSVASLVGGGALKCAPELVITTLLLGSKSTRALKSSLIDVLGRVSAATLGGRLEAILKIDVSAQLRQISVPILYLRAAKDRIVPRSASTEIGRLAKDVRIVELLGPHLLLQSLPRDSATAIRRFCEDVSISDFAQRPNQR